MMGNIPFVFFFILFLDISSEGSDANVCESFGTEAVYAGSGMCFRLIKTGMNFSDAQTFCVTELGGHLAELRTQYHRQTVIDFKEPRIWLGGSDEAEDGAWRWLSNNDLMNIPSQWWANNQPDSNDGGAHCLIIARQHLYDQACSIAYSTMCQKNIGNPCDDVLSGGDYYSGTCYKSVDQNMTIDTAQEHCEHMGAYLAEPTTSDQVDFLTMFAGMSFNSGNNVLIGLARNLPDDKFRWLSTGHAVIGSNWFALTEGGGTSEFAKRVVAVLNGSSIWVEMVDTVQAKFICQKSIPVYSHFYLAALPGSALTATDSALLTGSHTHSEPGWITIEVTFNPKGQVEQEHFLGQEGLEYRATLDSEKRSMVVRSTQPLVVTLTLWRNDLTSLSSSLLLSEVISSVAESFLAYPSAGDVSLGIIPSDDTSVQLDIAFSGGESGATASVEGVQYRSWPSMTFTASVTEQSQPFFMDSITGYNKAAFVHASQPVATFITEKQPLASSTEDVTFEHVLSTSHIGTSYVIFPSFPLNVKVKDTFTIVAVFNNTTVSVPRSDWYFLWSSLLVSYSYDVILEKAGDTLDLELSASGFRHINGSDPFYLYARLGGTGGSNRCTVTLLPDHLWTGSYIVQVVEPWTLLQYVYVVAVGENADMNTVSLVNRDGSTNLSSTNCVKVKGTNYMACYFDLASTTETYTLSRPSGEKFAAYMYGTKDKAAGCHQLGMDVSVVFGGSNIQQSFDANSYLDSVRVDPCPEQSTAITSNNIQTTAEETTLETTTEETTTASTMGISKEKTAEKSISSLLSPVDTFAYASANLVQLPDPLPESITEITTAVADSTTEVTTAATYITSGFTSDSLPVCVFKGHNLTQSSEEFQEMLESISEFLHVNSVNTSQARRKKESAQDDRASSVSLGVFSCSLIFVTLGLLVLSDVVSFSLAVVAFIRG